MIGRGTEADRPLGAPARRDTRNLTLGYPRSLFLSNFRCVEEEAAKLMEGKNLKVAVYRGKLPSWRINNLPQAVGGEVSGQG